ncbi:hypothetical protein [Sphingobium sp. D43FB]|uniref:hypothetical protein n=1 Tax=Sphingobium sp. D43FB TaxID=2017595 RepID=UPI000BB55140|nr:hypothetical protein [Sphingobium sp. D43FB]PBN41248.1 hypothetical protein SxD43FB_22875 [Sphingobium sp. D43FB]
MQMLTIKEMAAASGWPEARIRRLIVRRRVRHVRLDGLLLLPENALEEFLQANMVTPEDTHGNS